MAEEGGVERPDVHSQFDFICSSVFFHRLLLVICAIAITAPVVFKSRPGRDVSARAAFSVLSSSSGYVRISGAVRHPGIYPISANLMTIDAIKMADPLSPVILGLSGPEATMFLANGMALHVDVRPDGTAFLTKSLMTTVERLVMGVPLDINAMSESDFDRLPGIGPQMAKRIVEYRQKNGGFMLVGDLVSVEGIGEKKYKQFLKFF